MAACPLAAVNRWRRGGGNHSSTAAHKSRKDAHYLQRPRRQWRRRGRSSLFDHLLRGEGVMSHRIHGITYIRWRRSTTDRIAPTCRHANRTRDEMPSVPLPSRAGTPIIYLHTAKISGTLERARWSNHPAQVEAPACRRWEKEWRHGEAATEPPGKF